MKLKNLIYFFVLAFTTQTTRCNLPEKPIVAVITSYNNAKWATKCLDSVFAQVYDNFRVIYIDDCSSDSTGDIVEQYIQEHNLEHKVTLIRNKKRERKLFNIYNAYHSAEDWEIIAQIDGDDWLPNKNVFQTINTTYSSEDIWITYGKYERLNGKPSHSKPIPSHVIANNTIRTHGWIYGPIRTFYSWLFKLTKLQDLITINIHGFNSKFYPAANDTAMFYPMLEMANNDHIKFINHTTYFINTANPISGQVIESKIQRECHQEVQKKQRYQPLREPVTDTLEQLNETKADSLIIATDLLQTTSLLNSMGYHVTNIENIYVICQTTESDLPNLAQLKNQYPAVTLIDLATIESTLERNELMRELFSSLNDYVLFGNDSFIFNSDLDCNQCIKDIAQTYAYGVYINTGLKEGPFTESIEDKKIPCQRIKNDIYAWKYRNNNALFNRLAMSLHHKKSLIACLNNAPVNSINDLIDKWNSKKLSGESIGLFFKKQKLVAQKKVTPNQRIN